MDSCKENKKNNMRRNRPYNGQPHTVYGERGKQLVEGLNMRDICDCYVRGFLLSASHLVPEKYNEADKGEEANLTTNDLFGFDLNHVDPVAIMQNMMCSIEKMMKIYPNIPKLEASDEKENPFN